MLVSLTIGFLAQRYGGGFPELVGVHSQMRMSKRNSASRIERKAFAAPELGCLKCAPSGDKIGKD